MNIRSFILAAAMIGGAVALVPSGAGAFPTGICPAVNLDTDCQTGITLNANSTATIVSGLNNGPYDGVEDTLIGIVNNTGVTVTSVGLSGSNIFGFEGDGVCSFSGACTGGGFNSGTYYDPTGYAGKTSSGGLETFTVTNSSNGFINFTGGLADGATAWFSLEENLSALSFQVNTVNNDPVTTGTDVPEPASMALLGVGFAGLVASRRRRAM